MYFMAPGTFLRLGGSGRVFYALVSASCVTGASRKETGLGWAGQWCALSLSYVSAPQAVLLLSLSTHPTLVLWPLRVCTLTISASSWHCCSFLARLLAFAVQLGPLLSPSTPRSCLRGADAAVPPTPK